MIKPELVPDEVIKQFSTWQFPKCSENLMRRMLADALNVWPGAAVCHYTIGDNEGYEMVLPLPFPQERGDE